MNETNLSSLQQPQNKIVKFIKGLEDVRTCYKLTWANLLVFHIFGFEDYELPQTTYFLILWLNMNPIISIYFKTLYSFINLFGAKKIIFVKWKN
jgi:hypothetical protein